MSELKLLPCPFCGGEARIMLEEEDRPDECFHNIYCTSCGVQFWVKSKSEAIAAWNRRAQPENKPLTLDELRQMDGETVFVGDSKLWVGGSGKVSVGDGGVFDPYDQDGYWPLDGYGEWLAYRTKPERGEGE